MKARILLWKSSALMGWELETSSSHRAIKDLQGKKTLVVRYRVGGKKRIL